MKNLSHNKKIAIIVSIIFLVLIVVFSIYKLEKTHLLDKGAYKDLYTSLENDADNINSQKALCKYIISWAKENNLDYTLDDSYNIIFQQEASKRKSHVSPTVVVVNYNYENILDNKKALASAALIAKTKLDSGLKTVIFVNNKFNDGANYAALDPSYFPDNAKVIYLDYGKSSYLSAHSFSSVDQTITVPFAKEPVTCDTAIKIHIDGITSDCLDTSITKQISPIDLFSTLLTRLKSKSTICQLADFSVGNNGKMYPTSLEATIMINSYQVSSFTSYLDKRIKAFDKKKKTDFEDATYSYEVIEDASQYPEEAYTKETFDSLTTILYALKNGVYRYEEDDDLVSGYDVNDIYAIQSVYQIRTDDNGIYIDINGQANSKDSCNKLIEDNATACLLSNCTIKTTDQIKAFNNEDTKLLRTLQSTYFKVNDLSGTAIVLDKDMDTYFTPMSYLGMINSNADIVHVKESSKSATVITNMLLCYIQTKGNFLSL